MEDLRKSQSFLRSNFMKFDHYDKRDPINHLGCMVLLKRADLANINEITSARIKKKFNQILIKLVFINTTLHKIFRITRVLLRKNIMVLISNISLNISQICYKYKMMRKLFRMMLNRYS